MSTSYNKKSELCIAFDRISGYDEDGTPKGIAVVQIQNYIKDWDSEQYDAVVGKEEYTVSAEIRCAKQGDMIGVELVFKDWDDPELHRITAMCKEFEQHSKETAFGNEALVLTVSDYGEYSYFLTLISTFRIYNTDVPGVRFFAPVSNTSLYRLPEEAKQQIAHDWEQGLQNE